MKKKLILLVVVLLLLVGCKQDKFYLDSEHYGKAAITDIDSNRLKEIEKDGNKTLVFVYLPGCSSCTEFKAVLNDFTTEYNLGLYSISIRDVEGTKAENIEYAPSLMIYNDGKVVDYLDSASDEDLPYFKSVDKLKEWLDQYIYLSK